jgi:hypothetical protein
MNNFNTLQIPGAVEIMGRIEVTWLGILIPAFILVLSIIAVWGVYNYYNKK